jgi:F-type H+-transporting ATPase subunit epsilon
MNTLSLTLLTPQGLIYEGEVLEAYFPSIDGPLGLLPGHTPFIAQLAPSGVIRLKDKDGMLLYFAVRQGAVEVRPDKTIGLSEECVKMPSVEEAEKYLSSRNQAKLENDSDVARAGAALAGQYAASKN